jgi:hypothetical protein
MQQKEYNVLQRRSSELTKARGKARFIRRELLFNVVLWMVITFGTQLGEKRTQSLSLRGILLTSLMMLPVFLLGGYLAAIWKWKDFEKKYSWMP